jgi:hypothetical protein
MIVNIDRLMLATFPKCDPWFRQLLHATPRLVFAILIGVTIAHPLTLRLFEPEILDTIAEETEADRHRAADQRDQRRKQQHYDSIEEDYRKAIGRLESRKSAFLTRSEVLGRIGDKRPQAAVTRLFVSILFLWVEVVRCL